MFTLFMSLYYSMLQGSWTLLSMSAIIPFLKKIGNEIGLLVTSIFGDNTMDTFGNVLFDNMFIQGYGTFNCLYLTIALILATITSIGIVVMAVKGIKRVFGVFFMGIR